MIKGLVSIVVPVYNAGKWIEDTILSVKSQTYKEWELILVDDLSTDDSVKVMELYEGPDIRVIKTSKNHGAAYARNLGISEAGGQYICFIDADDLWAPDKLEKQLSFMKEKEAAFGFTGYEFADESGIGVALIGNDEVYTKMKGSGRADFAQLFSRIGMRKQVLTSTNSRDDVKNVFCSVPDDESIEILYRISRTAYGLRGAVNVYINTVAVFGMIDAPKIARMAKEMNIGG